jgi:trehalose 6-phosphate phosphatase
VTGAAEHGGKHWGQHAARLAALLGARPLGLATDLDGTLSPITLDGPPGVSPALRGAIAALAERWAVVALISGRPVAAVQAVIDLPGLEVFGIHGFERLAGGVATLVPGAVRWQEAIERATGELRVLVERCGAAMQTKGITVVVDWRCCPDPGVVPALASSVAAVAAAHGLAVLHARKSLEVHPPIDVDKGTCLTVLAQEHRLGGLLYLGDDHSDISAFRALRRMREEGRLAGLALGVVSAEMPEGLVEAADLVLDGVADVERFFAWLCVRA